MYSVDGLETKLQTALLNANDVINLKIAKDGKPLVAEKISAGFYVKIGETEAKIGYGTISDFLRGTLYLACGRETEQKRAFDEMGVMIDCSRNAVPKVQTVKNYAAFLAALGYTYIHLYTEDTLEIKDNPYFGYMRGRYTKEEIREIDEYCASVGIELVPCIQTLAHLNQITRYADYADIIDCNDILLCGEDKPYKLIDDIFRTVAENFTSRKVNIGMDEAHMLGLGNYLDKHGYHERSEIMMKHLKKVLEIAAKYGFTCSMWSDMFFRMFSHGDYYSEIENVPQAVLDKIPNNLKLVYWDYYNTEYGHYARMLKNHFKMSENIAFAGGAWKWVGFAPLNDYSIRTMKPSVKACRDYGVKDYFITSWGDNGGEGMLNSVLPSFYYAAMLSYGEKCDKRIFEHMTGVAFDQFKKLDLPNEVTKGKAQRNNSSRYFLYDDLLYGAFDSLLKEDFSETYRSFKRSLSRLNKGKYGYLFAYMAALCDVLSYKTELSLQIKKAYAGGDKEALKEYATSGMKKLISSVQKFYEAFAKAWETENKPFGFEVQDQRLGGLIARLKAIQKKLCDYAENKIGCIEELDEKHLPCGYIGNIDLEHVIFNSWAKNISVGIV